MPTFDIVNKLDMEAFKNALDGVKREIVNRYDFKGSKSEILEKEDAYFIIADSDMKLSQIKDILLKNLVRKAVDSKSINFDKIEKASGNMVRQKIILIEGIEKDIAQNIIKKIKEAKLKIQVSIQGDQLRVSGKKRDDLQNTISALKGIDFSIPLNFINFRD